MKSSSSNQRLSRIRVSYLTSKVTKEHLMEIFSSYGCIKGIEMLPSSVETKGSLNESHLLYQSADIDFETKSEAINAVRYMNGAANQVSIAKESRSDLQNESESLLSSSKRKRNTSEVGLEVDVNNKRTALGSFKLKGYSAERKGEREDMQDAHVVMDDFISEVDKPPVGVYHMSYYAVFDGHGGAKASNFAAQRLHKIIAQKFPKAMESFDIDIKRCFTDSFKRLDDDFLNEARQKKPSWKDGTTAVSVLVVNNTLYIGNLGDSKAILCRFNASTKTHVAIPLTVDHSPTLYEERMRIQKAGGHVREGRVMGILEVSRSIGDGPFKKHGISCIPDVKRCQLQENDRFILIACDGLWKRFDNNLAIEFVNNILNDENIKGTETKDGSEVRWETACARITNEAVRRLSADNVTVILVAISHQPSGH